MSHSYNSLFFVTLAAVLGPWISTRALRSVVPSVVIEIVFGYILGPHVLGVAVETSSITFLAAFGFSYLMFLSGIELDFNLMTQKSEDGGAPPWLRGLVFFLITIVISFAVAWGLSGLGYIHNLVLGTLLLSTTSLGLVTPLLKERGWLSAKFGQEMLLYALIADVTTLIAFTAYITFHSTGNAFSFLLIMVLLLFFVFVYRVLLAARHLRIFRVVENATSEIGIRASFALILAFLAIAESLGTVVVVGAFLAGAIISLMADKHSILTHKLNSMGYGFFIPIFFVNVGMRFNLDTLSGKGPFIITLVVLVVTMLVNKLLPALLFLRKFSFRQRFAGGFLLTSRLSLMIAASQIAQQSGLLSAQMSNGFVLLALVTCIAGPALFNHTITGVPIPTEDDGDKQLLTDLVIDRQSLPPDWEIRMIEVRSHLVHELPIRSLHLPYDLLFVSIIRDDERLIPRGHTKLEQFDMVQVMGTPADVAALKSQLSEGKINP